MIKYFNSTEPEIQNFSTGIFVEDFDFEKRASVSPMDVFLSHSSADKDALPKAIGFLTQFGAKVYVDKMDKELPQRTSAETGRKIKERITQCRKFIVLVTANSKNSRWIPWELGIADEQKKLPNVALLPDIANQSNVEWAAQEYLGLYPQIVNTNFKDQTSPIWMVRNHHNNTGVPLKDWLKN
jgi:hypothetical protein